MHFIFFTKCTFPKLRSVTTPVFIYLKLLLLFLTTRDPSFYILMISRILVYKSYFICIYKFIPLSDLKITYIFYIWWIWFLKWIFIVFNSYCLTRNIFWFRSISFWGGCLMKLYIYGLPVVSIVDWVTLNPPSWRPYSEMTFLVNLLTSYC